jgi:hypothetical protein
MFKESRRQSISEEQKVPENDSEASNGSTVPTRKQRLEKPLPKRKKSVPVKEKQEYESGDLVLYRRKVYTVVEPLNSTKRKYIIAKGKFDKSKLSSASLVKKIASKNELTKYVKKDTWIRRYTDNESDEQLKLDKEHELREAPEAGDYMSYAGRIYILFNTRVSSIYRNGNLVRYCVLKTARKIGQWREMNTNMKKLHLTLKQKHAFKEGKLRNVDDL